MEVFNPGQRWISETEPELGLGLVVKVAMRSVQILYPARGEMRAYATKNAPIKRVRLSKGDEVKSSEGSVFIVEKVHEEDGILRYEGGGRTLTESDLADTLSFDKPENRLFVGHVDEWQDFDLRLETLTHHHHVCSSSVRGFIGGKVELLPHQLFIAKEVSSRHLPRVLLADEVGLGKTIEACLILHRMLIAGKVKRVLVLVPEPLIHQWFVELLRRFNLNFSIYDEERCIAIESGMDGGNPFLDDQLVLCGLEFLAHNQTRNAQVRTADWDMLIVDEAHHLRWSSEKASHEYTLVEHLASTTPCLLLLTATPEQLGLQSHFCRLRLLDPHRYPDYDRFVAELTSYEKVADQANELLSDHDETALQELLDRHGPGRVVFRNTRAAMAHFPTRIPCRIPLDPPKADEDNPHIEWLAEFLRADRSRKVLVICPSKEEVLAMDEALRKQINVKTALFHENLPLIQRDRQAAWFSEPDGAQILLSSKIGGEGRNFQFVHDLVLFALADDPEVIEQQIGRLDRIGQTHDIHIHLPYIRGTEEANRVRWYDEGLNVFREPLVGGYELLNHFRDRISLVDDQLISDTKSFREEVHAGIERGRDRLLELNSCRPMIAQEVIQEIQHEDACPALEDYLTRMFDHFGVDMDHLDDRDYLIRPGPMFHELFPLREEGLRITFDRKQAIVREDITLMSWDHPMVEGGMELILGREKGNCAFAVSEGLHGFLVKAAFVLECIASWDAAALRFLPPTPIVIQIDHTLSEILETPSQLRTGDLWETLEQESLRRERILAVLVEARKRAEERVPGIIARASDQMHSVLDKEIQRLKDLKRINDHVRDDEVELAERQIGALEEVLRKARLRLDSVLLIGGTEPCWI